MPDLSFTHRFEPSQAEDPGFGLVLLHGTGADENDLVPLGRQVAPDAPLLSPLGKVRENGQPRWFKRKRPGVFDEEDLRTRADELARFLEDAADEYGLDTARLVALGFSNGSNIAATLLLLHPNVLRAAVLLRPMTPLEPATLPDLEGIPVFMAAGRNDRLVPQESVETLASMLRTAGADVTLRWANAGHGLTRDEVQDAQEWFKANDTRLSTPRRRPP